jgi:integrase
MIGIRRDEYGYRAYVKVSGRQRERRFPPETTLKTMQAWRDEARVALRRRPVRLSKGTLALDVEHYLQLETIRALLSIKSRRCELAAWVDLYGERRREDLTRDDVLAARERWLGERYAPKTINHRVRALRSLYRRLDGSTTPTPCDDVPKLAEPDAAPAFVAPTLITRVAAKIVDPKTRARFMVLASTGQRPAQLRRAEPADVSLSKKLWLVRPAKRGNPIPVALTEDMIQAFRAFRSANAWGAYDGSDFVRALRAAGWPPHIRPYNLKHTIGITLAESAAEWEDIKDWFGHKDIKTTRIYTGVVAKRLHTTSRLLSGRLQWLAVPAFREGQRQKRPVSNGNRTYKKSADSTTKSRKIG